MSWYKFSKDYVNVILDDKERKQFMNSTKMHQNPLVEDPEGVQIENQLDPSRADTTENPNLKNEKRQPNNYFAHGQGGDYRMQENKDLIMNSNPDSFTDVSYWNSN